MENKNSFTRDEIIVINTSLNFQLKENEKIGMKSNFILINQIKVKLHVNEIDEFSEEEALFIIGVISVLISPDPKVKELKKSITKKLNLGEQTIGIIK